MKIAVIVKIKKIKKCIVDFSIAKSQQNERKLVFWYFSIGILICGPLTREFKTFKIEANRGSQVLETLWIDYQNEHIV